MIEKLSREDLELIDAYRMRYALNDKKEVDEDRIAPVTSILKEWEYGKEQFLSKVFGDNLILEKEIEFETSTIRLMRELEQAYYSDAKAYSFITNFYDILNIFPIEAQGEMTLMVCRDVLIQNILPEKIVIPITEKYNKELVFSKGMKTIKALKIFSEAYNIENFEEFRLLHSRVLNKKTAKGTLCLSIHPLDYMTMSDNNNDWSSCMSWIDNGCYRQGTVEMMNSPCVVVGYLKSKNPFEFYKGAWDDEKCKNSYIGTWNSKKWRCLYLVHENFISEVKQYPMTSTQANECCLKWLKELVEAAYPNQIKYTDDFTFKEEECRESKEYDYYPCIITEKYGVLNPETYAMYNDFGATCHTGYANIKNKPSELYNIVYSGMSQCMCCGEDMSELMSEGDAEGLLICNNCSVLKSCCNCGNEINILTDAYYEVDDDIICENCYNNHTVIDSLTGERHVDYNIKRLYIKNSDNDLLFHLNVSNRFIDDVIWWQDNFTKGKNIYVRNPNANHYIYVVDENNITEDGWIRIIPILFKEQYEEDQSLQFNITKIKNFLKNNKEGHLNIFYDGFISCADIIYNNAEQKIAN